jgi:hypothetical protein
LSASSVVMLQARPKALELAELGFVKPSQAGLLGAALDKRSQIHRLRLWQDEGVARVLYVVIGCIVVNAVAEFRQPVSYNVMTISGDEFHHHSRTISEPIIMSACWYELSGIIPAKRGRARRRENGVERRVLTIGKFWLSERSMPGQFLYV